MYELPPLAAYEDDAITIVCQKAAQAAGISWTDCDRGSFNCPGCPLETMSISWPDALERKE